MIYPLLRRFSTGLLNLAVKKGSKTVKNKKVKKVNVKNSAEEATDDMVRILNVAEKNDAAKSLADIMSRGGFRKVIVCFSRFLVISYLCALVPYHFVPKAIPFRTQVIIIVFDI